MQWVSVPNSYHATATVLQQPDLVRLHAVYAKILQQAVWCRNLELRPRLLMQGHDTT